MLGSAMIAHGTTRPDRPPLVAPDQIEHHQADMSVTVGGEVTLGALQEHLAATGQWLPIDGSPDLTIGQAVETNSTGPLRLGYGAWRDLLLGAQFVTPDGRQITAGGRTLKNVAGYDLTKLTVGQDRELARVIAITARTYRRPTHALLVQLGHDRRIGDLLPTPLRPQWAMRTSAGLECGYLGDERTIAYIEQQITTIHPRSVTHRSLEQDIADRAARWRWPVEGMTRLMVPPASVEQIVAEIPNSTWVADPAHGVILTTEPPPNRPGLRGTRLVNGNLVPIGLTDSEVRLHERLRRAMGSST